MTSAGKNAYHAFQTALGTKDPVPFERLSMREQDAWSAIDNFQRDTAVYAEVLEVDLSEAKREIQRLRSKLAIAPNSGRKRKAPAK